VLHNRTVTKPSLVPVETAAFTVRRPEDVSPDLAALVAKETELRALQRRLEDEQAELLGQLQFAPAVSKADVRAAELLGDLGADNVATKRERLRAIADDLAAVGRALHTVRERVRFARNTACREICREVFPVYAERVGTVANALIALHRTIGLRPFNLAWIDTRVRGFLAEAVEHGLVQLADIPEDLR
jgi:hypothetical protein